MPGRRALGEEGEKLVQSKLESNLFTLSGIVGAMMFSYCLCYFWYMLYIPTMCDGCLPDNTPCPTRYSFGFIHGLGSRKYLETTQLMETTRLYKFLVIAVAFALSYDILILLEMLCRLRPHKALSQTVCSACFQTPFELFEGATSKSRVLEEYRLDGRYLLILYTAFQLVKQVKELWAPTITPASWLAEGIAQFDFTRDLPWAFLQSNDRFVGLLSEALWHRKHSPDSMELSRLVREKEHSSKALELSGLVRERDADLTEEIRLLQQYSMSEGVTSSGSNSTSDPEASSSWATTGGEDTDNWNFSQQFARFKIPLIAAAVADLTCAVALPVTAVVRAQPTYNMSAVRYECNFGDVACAQLAAIQWRGTPLEEAVAKETDTNVSMAAVSALGEMNRTEAVQPLCTALMNSTGVNVRTAAAWALGKMKSTEAVQPLFTTLMNDTDFDVRKAAASALGVITGHDDVPARKGGPSPAAPRCFTGFDT